MLNLSYEGLKKNGIKIGQRIKLNNYILYIIQLIKFSRKIQKKIF